MSALNASQSRFSVFSGDADFWDRQDFQDQLIIPPICVHPRPVFTAHGSLLTFIRIVVFQRLGDGAWHQAVDRLPKPEPLADGGRRMRMQRRFRRCRDGMRFKYTRVWRRAAYKLVAKPLILILMNPYTFPLMSRMELHKPRRSHRLVTARSRYSFQVQASQQMHTCGPSNETKSRYCELGRTAQAS